MYPALDRAQRLMKHFRNFMIFEPVKIQEKGVFENFRKIMNRTLDVLDTQLGLRCVGYDSLVVIQEEIVPGLVKNGVLLGLSAVIIDKNIPHDGVKPSLHIRTNIVFILIGKSPKKRFLE